MRCAPLRCSADSPGRARSLLSDEPHYVQRYARHHWELIAQGLSEEEARTTLDSAIADAQRRLEKAAAKGKSEDDFDKEDIELASLVPSERSLEFIDAVQEEEEEVLERMAYFRALQADGYEEEEGEYEEGEEEEEEEADDEEEEEEAEAEAADGEPARS